MKRTVTFLDISATILEYSLFGIGSLAMIALLPLLRITPLNKDTKKEFLHKLIYNYFRFLVGACPSLRVNIINPCGENFKKPAIIISNHQSMVDIFLALTLAAKTIIITKDWVWNNPILGGVARCADYYCADDGFEKLKDKIKDKLDRGYFIFIFPEGKRSYTGEIDRFHKGAFYLAQELKADILPVVIHGTINSVPRGSRLIRESLITLKYLPRIPASDGSFGNNYTDRSKKIRRYFIEEYEKI